MLLEPIIAQITAYSVGLDLAPGWLTILSLPAVLLGTFYVNRGTYIMIQQNMRLLPTGSLPPQPDAVQQSKDAAGDKTLAEEARIREQIAKMEERVQLMKVNADNLNQLVESREATDRSKGALHAAGFGSGVYNSKNSLE